MAVTAEITYEVDVEDVEYLRHGERPLLARLFRPRGTGPFPAMVSLHGGAWCMYDRTIDDDVNESLAKTGVVVAAVDFTMPPDGPYPASMADVNYAIRWVKSRAEELGTRADTVGVMGGSSGGHQAMLAAMRPGDARYSSLPLPAGTPAHAATVRCAVLLAPVIDPLGRYRYAKELAAAGKEPAMTEQVLPAHDSYWQTEEAMAEGNPVLALERGERLELPPVLYVQGSTDIAHPLAHLERFVALYRAAGGHLDLELAEGAGQGFLRRDPDGAAAVQARLRVAEFVHQHVG